MKEYTVCMSNLPLTPLSPNSHGPEACKSEEFYEKEKAVEFAKSASNNWEYVDVYKGDQMILSLQDGNVYVDNKLICSIDELNNDVKPIL